MASEAFTPALDQAADLAGLKRQAEQLMAEFQVAIAARRTADATGCEYLDSRRDLIVATQLRVTAEQLARAANAEEVRDACARRYLPAQARRVLRSARLVHATAAGVTALSIIGAGF